MLVAVLSQALDGVNLLAVNARLSLESYLLRAAAFSRGLLSLALLMRVGEVYIVYRRTSLAAFKDNAACLCLIRLILL